jgi:hypothetical protein
MRVWLAVAVSVGCSHATATPSAPATRPSAPNASVLVDSAAPLPADAEAETDLPGPPGKATHDAPRRRPEEVESLLFVPKDAHPHCEGDGDAIVECLLAARWVTDLRAARVAKDLYERTGDIAGALPEETMQGGFRGTLHLVPALPVQGDLRHLMWVADATRDYDAFFDALAADGGSPRYVWRGYAFRFMRSVAARTPSAYSSGWTIAYNLSGSLNTSADAVRELLFHEIFHSNDEDHGDWSVRVLAPTFDSIVARCGTRIACLTPFTPTEMTVRGGTYYAFQPNNGAAVREYAAELALRYYREQRAIARGLPAPKPFKCGPEENATAWKLLVDEFFGGVDRSRACG